MGEQIISIIHERRKAQNALKLLPVKIRGFYSTEFGCGIGNTEGEFLGLACRVCHTWREYGHDESCPVLELEECKNEIGC